MTTLQVDVVGEKHTKHSMLYNVDMYTGVLVVWIFWRYNQCILTFAMCGVE